jgi:hypothetical protein
MQCSNYQVKYLEENTVAILADISHIFKNCVLAFQESDVSYLGTLSVNIDYMI